jgi:hypothetical protein
VLTDMILLIAIAQLASLVLFLSASAARNIIFRFAHAR